RLVQDEVGALEGAQAAVEIADVAFDEVISGRRLGADPRHHVVDVALVTGREVVEADDPLTEPQELLREVGADESGRAGDDPGPGVLREFFPDPLVFSHVISQVETKGGAQSAGSGCGSAGARAGSATSDTET